MVVEAWNVCRMNRQTEDKILETQTEALVEENCRMRSLDQSNNGVNRKNRVKDTKMGWIVL